MGKTCGITGHRKLSPEKMNTIKIQLRQEILSAIAEGYDHFISGFADGVDLLFAEVVLELKKESPVRLEAAIPYRNRVKNGNAALKKLFSECDAFAVINEKYSPACFLDRNKWMVNNADMILAVYDGRITGGTVFTIEYAKAMGKEIREIHI